MLAACHGKGECRKLFADRKIAEYKDWEQYLHHFDTNALEHKHYMCKIETA